MAQSDTHLAPFALKVYQHLWAETDLTLQSLADHFAVSVLLIRGVLNRIEAAGYDVPLALKKRD